MSPVSMSSTSPVPTIVRRFVAVIVLLLVAIMTTACSSPRNTNAKPESSTQTSSAEEPTLPVPDGADQSEEPSSKGWSIDFSTMPDGPLSRGNWAFDVAPSAGVDWDNGDQEIPVLGYSGETVAYTDRAKNIRVEDGLLVIEAHHEKLLGADYTSGRLTTKWHQDFTYGTLNVRAKMPEKTWPAIWMLPSHNVHGLQEDEPGHDYGRSYELNGEIDIAEIDAAMPGVVQADVHTIAADADGESHGERSVGRTLYDEFHDYGVRWSPDELELMIDGEIYFTYQRKGGPKQWPFDQKFHLLMNVAVGGEMGGSPSPADFATSRRMEVQTITWSPLQ